MKLNLTEDLLLGNCFDGSRGTAKALLFNSCPLVLLPKNEIQAPQNPPRRPLKILPMGNCLLEKKHR
jgi:hypothetical protein